MESEVGDEDGAFHLHLSDHSPCSEIEGEVGYHGGVDPQPDAANAPNHMTEIRTGQAGYAGCVRGVMCGAGEGWRSSVA